MSKNKIPYVEKAMETNEEISELWCKLKDCSPEKLVKISNDTKKPALEIIIAKSILIACKDGISNIDTILDRVCPMATNLNLRTFISGMSNPYEFLDKKE